MNRILIITPKESDMSELLLRNCPGSACYAPTSEHIPYDTFDAACLLGGMEQTPWALPAPVRVAIERMREMGKPVFCEFISSISRMHHAQPLRSSHHRLMVCDGAFSDLAVGDVLDDHYNERVPYLYMPQEGVRVMLRYFDHICAHDHIDMTPEEMAAGSFGMGAIDEKTWLCAFRLCNFRRARLAPRASWEQLLRAIVCHLAGEAVTLSFLPPVCSHERDARVSCAADTDAAVERGLAWFTRADMLLQGGSLGVKEGFSHHVCAESGVQLRANTVRADCTGEVGGAYLLSAIRTGDAGCRAIFERTAKYCFDYMQIKEGPHAGMIRWTEVAWEVCYQDDVARAILPTLLCENFGGGSAYFADACLALDYLVKTTGADGLRVFRTDICDMSEARWEQLKSAGVGIPCAHYNAYYHAALLMATRAGGSALYAEVAERGLTTLMTLYPHNRRETSETEEMCRLVLPLALLYEWSGKSEHYDWLCRVVDDLERVEHPSGGYAEWDTDYRANCSRNHMGECALLANNGDPVADLLYSNNWLPLGFAYAYYVTGEERFYQKWLRHARFMVAAQLRSDDPLLDGAWTRAMDMDRMEIYGVPHDVGWAPCCIESGWTVGEILMGLQFMHIAEAKWNKV